MSLHPGMRVKAHGQNATVLKVEGNSILVKYDKGGSYYVWRQHIKGMGSAEA